MRKGIYVNGHLVRCSIRCIRAKRDECECRCHTEHHQGKGIPTGAKITAPDPFPERTRVAAEHRTYLEARHDQAEEATRGNLLSARAPAGYNSRRFFDGSRAPRRYMSDELKDWFRDNGSNLTAREYRAQAEETNDETLLGYPGGY